MFNAWTFLDRAVRCVLIALMIGASTVILAAGSPVALAQGAIFGPITFAELADDQDCPVDPPSTPVFAPGITTLRGFFSYQGMTPETTWTARWILNDEEISLTEGFWTRDADGPCAFVSLQANDWPAGRQAGELPPGEYKLILTTSDFSVEMAEARVGVRPVELLQSDQFDWFIFFDPAVWAIAQHTSAPGLEQLRLTDGDTVVDYALFDAPGLTPEACIENVLALRAGAPGIVTIEALSAEGGPPVIFPPFPNADPATNAAAQASTDLVLTVEHGEQRLKLAAREECRQIAPGALQYRSTVVPAVHFNEWGGSYGPRPELASSAPITDFYEWGAPATVDDGSGSSSLTLAPYFFCNEVFKVVARNTGTTGHVTVDPARFVAVYRDDPAAGELAGQSVQPTLYGWIYPALAPESKLVLGPGETALFEFGLPRIEYDLYYQPGSGPPVFLNSNTSGCGAGGATPVLIDIE